MTDCHGHVIALTDAHLLFNEICHAFAHAAGDVSNNTPEAILKTEKDIHNDAKLIHQANVMAIATRQAKASTRAYEQQDRQTRWIVHM